MTKKSAGILLYRINDKTLEVLLVHPGGPFFVRKDAGAWTIPKGEYPDEEEPLAAALREFEEETGTRPEGETIALTPVKQKGGKVVQAWAVQGEIDADTIKSNTFQLEYPYRSGKWIEVPEIDKAKWLGVEEARIKMNPAQVALVDELQQLLLTYQR
ncbi:NUDIX domain-containing protein [Mucilaginibacter daejeonensis]|uniref:NUDIX domain-containing protein n=1 Tax=Mucilaginibacter daejeonensis TaxID=398049 RepID=UPI001D1702D7|nr:NUDIX domain-containing protein [Mucilaginibacter daejeonensis]UEG51819.1 NUDIX domain-containing protein [Mucilaginibacter daejeonensis]